MPAASRWSPDPTDSPGIASKGCDLDHRGARRPVLRGYQFVHPDKELPHAYAPDPRCCGRLRRRPRRDGRQFRPRGGVLLPPDVSAVAAALVRSPDPAGARATTRAGSATGDGRRRRAGQAFRRDAREARRGEVELRLVGQERKVAGEIQVQLLAGTAHPQRSSGAASEQEQRTRQRLGAPGKPREWRQYAARRATGPAHRLQRERRRAGAQLPPAPAAPSAIPSTRSSARCSSRGSTRSSSSRISRAQPKQQLTARATRKRGPELARIRSASMFA